MKQLNHKCLTVCSLNPKLVLVLDKIIYTTFCHSFAIIVR